MKEETEQMYTIILSWPVTTEGVVFHQKYLLKKKQFMKCNDSIDKFIDSGPI
jgi:hypothetical protein